MSASSVATGIAKCVGFVFQLRELVRDAKASEIVRQLDNELSSVKQDLLHLEEENAALRLKDKETQLDMRQLKDAHSQAIRDLQAQQAEEIARMRPKQTEAQLPRMEHDTRRMLDYIFHQSRPCTRDNIQEVVRLPNLNFIKYHCDILIARGLIQIVGLSSTDPRWDALGDNTAYEITPKGREFHVQSDR